MLLVRLDLKFLCFFRLASGTAVDWYPAHYFSTADCSGEKDPVLSFTERGKRFYRRCAKLLMRTVVAYAFYFHKVLLNCVNHPHFLPFTYYP